VVRWRGWLVVGEDLINAKDHICEEQRALHRVAFTTPYAPSTEEDGASDCDSYECGIDVADLWEFRHSPEEVDRARDD